jgi:hypothetical protein
MVVEIKIYRKHGSLFWMNWKSPGDSRISWKRWKSDNISGLDACLMYKSMASIWSRSLSEFQSSGVFVFRTCFQISLGESNPYHRWTINSTTTCVAGVLADLNLSIRARCIFVFPLQELRGKIPISDLYYPCLSELATKSERLALEARPGSSTLFRKTGQYHTFQQVPRFRR